MEKEKILDIPVCKTSYEDFILTIINDIKSGQKKKIVAINPEKILKARKDSSLDLLLKDFDYQIADGIGIIFASKLQKGKIKNRITGIDCMEIICDKSRDIAAKIFLYGAAPGVAQKAKENLELKYPNIKIVGTIDGYNKDNNYIIETINKSKADILFVALGSPKQEYWIRDNADKLNVKIFQGVGGSFDVICGNIKRAPLWIQKLGLEWFYRLLKQPSRIGRQLKLFRFLFLVKGSKN